MPLPYKVNFKLPLEYLSLQDWNNFVQNLIFINQYGTAKLLQYYKNGSFQNLKDVFAKYLYVAQLKVNGYNVLHNLSEPLAYTFGNVFQELANKPSINLPEINVPVSSINYKLPPVEKQIEALIPNLISKISIPINIAGTQFTFSGNSNLAQLTSQYLQSVYLQTWRSITLQNLGNSSVQINNSIYLMPKQCLKITVSNPQEVQISAQSSTLLSELIEFNVIPITAYTITITNSQPDPTPSPFQQLLILNLSNIISSPSQLLNLQFCLDSQCKTPLYSWIESYNSNLSNVYIWINLPISIPANSSITIYMFVRNSIQYPYTGMRPDLTSTYAQYDNGKNVFLIYFNGNEPLSNFNTEGNTIQQISTIGPLGNTINAIYLSGYSNNVGFVYTGKSVPNQPVIVEASAKDMDNQTGGLGADNGQAGIADSTNTAIINAIGVTMGNNSDYFSQDFYINGSETRGYNLQGSAVSQWVYAWVVYQGSSASSWSGCIAPQLYSSNGGYCGTVNNNPLSSSTQLYLAVIGGVGYYDYWQTAWNFMRMRTYPPNGVMPSNTNPQLTTIYVA
ncbi:DUF2341 domain-containing protein [Sulfolobus islandicus rod-shaped virus 1]|uniref:Uncharacterized protein 562 n=1 Tax=Sulfolobus islandicus rod-shaped virus 1 TaxID=157898 RepID=Y562_SIRV1|nr:DUF2341 domain-containing protein [Sulfolobus islandicus rod-shaped virus 1]Q8QL25.1 RecName: Full=Uncharacterized protein 562 [Sulfolobus islandicus rod-shaped virus 1]CAC93986.1 hypothetical protein [Sulfolobus islandicus rod-shaped virus 1]